MLACMRDWLVNIPTPELPAVDVEPSLTYLASDAALASLDRDPYWPKWDSPWWHALLMLELGEARRIPVRAARALADAVDRMPFHDFPVDGLPPGVDPRRDIMCHCALGCLTQVLVACGVELPAWFAPWFPRYQMRDGGLNCDETAYLVEDECPSSMVGTIAPFEAMRAVAPDSPFVARAAGLLVARRLTDGSPTRHNAEERDAAPRWMQLCFPRFYFYDVLRGLAALAGWARDTGAAIPHAIVRAGRRVPRPRLSRRRRAHRPRGLRRRRHDAARQRRVDAWPRRDALPAPRRDMRDRRAERGADPAVDRDAARADRARRARADHSAHVLNPAITSRRWGG